MDPDSGEATDNLIPQVITMFEELGTNCTRVSQVINSKDKIVFKAIQDGIDRYNTQHSQTNVDKVCMYVTQYTSVQWRLILGEEVDVT